MWSFLLLFCALVGVSCGLKCDMSYTKENGERTNAEEGSDSKCRDKLDLCYTQLIFPGKTRGLVRSCQPKWLCAKNGPYCFENNATCCCEGDMCNTELPKEMEGWQKRQYKPSQRVKREGEEATVKTESTTEAEETTTETNGEPDEPSPNVEQPPVGEPNVEQPPVGEPNVEQPPVGEPNVEQPPVGEPNVEQPPVGEPNVEQPPVGEPNVEQPPVGEPKVEPVGEPKVEQPPVEQPKVEEKEAEPSTEEPKVEEPKVADSSTAIPETNGTEVSPDGQEGGEDVTASAVAKATGIAAIFLLFLQQ